MSDSLSVIRSLLRRLDTGEIDIDTFKREFVPLAWTIDQQDSAAAFAQEIELRLAEYSDGHWTEEELLEQLAALTASRR